MTEKSDLPRTPWLSRAAANQRPSRDGGTGRDPPATTTEEETFLIERIPVRFVVVILVLPSEGSAVVGRERWQALSSRART